MQQVRKYGTSTQNQMRPRSRYSQILYFIFLFTNLDPTVTGRLLPDPSSAANVPDPRPFVLQPRTEQVVAVRAAKEVWDHYIKLNEEAKQMFLDTISLVIKLDGDRIVVVPDYDQAATGAIWMGERLGGGGRHKKNRRRKSKRRKSTRRKSTRRKTKKSKSKRRKSRRRRR